MEFFQSAAENPFLFASGLLVLGAVLLVLALAGMFIPLPTIQNSKRRRVIKIKDWIPTVGLIGATTVLIGLVVLWVVVFYPPPVS